MRSGHDRIRLRMALHAGEIIRYEHGAAGAAINLAFRLVDAEPLKAALEGSSGALAVIVSSWFFERGCAACRSGRCSQLPVCACGSERDQDQPA